MHLIKSNSYNNHNGIAISVFMRIPSFSKCKFFQNPTATLDGSPNKVYTFGYVCWRHALHMMHDKAACLSAQEMKPSHRQRPPVNYQGLSSLAPAPACNAFTYNELLLDCHMHVCVPHAVAYESDNEYVIVLCCSTYSRIHEYTRA